MTVSRGSLPATVKIENNYADIINGFYLTLYVPNTVQIEQQSVLIDKTYTTAYLFESDEPDTIYEGFTAYRWVFDQPTDFEGIAVEQSHTYEIVYQTSEVLNDVLFSWVGWVIDGGKPLFGFN